MSVKILDTIVEDKGLLDSYLSKNQLDRIKAMILAASSSEHTIKLLHKAAGVQSWSLLFYPDWLD